MSDSIPWAVPIWQGPASSGLRRHWCGRALLRLVALLGAVLLAAVVGPVAVSRANVLFNETFTHPTVSVPGLTVGATTNGGAFKQACLTASTATTQTPIRGCTAQAAIPAGGDPDGSGALRLTDNENFVAGYVLYNVPLPLTEGLDITFDYYSYDTTAIPADGLSLFLVNGNTTLTQPGGVGGSLSYAQYMVAGQTPHPGVANGYLGVGLDEFGNFTNDAEDRGSGCANPSPYTGLHPNYVALRGPGNGFSGYCLLAANPTPAPLAVGSAKTRTAPGVKQVVEIVVDPPGGTDPPGDPSPQVTVTINGTQVLQASEPPDPPPTFKFGLGASTGGDDDIHEIQNVAINTILPLPDLTVTQTPAGSPVAGQPLTYTVQGTVGASGGSEDQPVTITDTLPPGDTALSPPTGQGWDCSATVPGSSLVSCTYTPTAPLPPGTTLPPISVPTLIPPSAAGPHTNTAVISSTDNGNTMAQSTATATITPAPAPPPPKLPPPAPPVDTTAQADVYITVTPPSTVPLIGQPAVFTVTAGNHGPDPDKGVTVSIPVPSGSTVESVPPACEVINDVILCDAGNLPVGARTTFQIVVSPDAAGPLSMTATVTGAVPDPNPANNVASAQVIVPPPPPPPLAADLGVTISPISPTVTQGSAVTFNVTATNHGPVPSTGVVVGIPIPAGSSPVKIPHGCTRHGQVVVCSVGALGVGKGRTFSITVRPNGTGKLTAAATVRGDQPDPNPANNHASATVLVDPALKLHDHINTRYALDGTSVHFTLTVATRGGIARHVTVCDTIPAGLKIVAAPGARIIGQRVCLTLARVGTHPRKLTIEAVAAGVLSSQTVHDGASATARDTKRVSASVPLRLVAPISPSFTG